MLTRTTNNTQIDASASSPQRSESQESQVSGYINPGHTQPTTMASATLPGMRSPMTPRSNAPSPRPKFDSDLLKAYVKKLLSTTLQGASWPEARDRDRVRAWMKEIGERVKERMIGTYSSPCMLYIDDQTMKSEIEPRGL